MRQSRLLDEYHAYALERLAKADLRVLSDDEIVDALTNVFRGLAIAAQLIPRGTRLFRARVMDSRPRLIGEVEPPPAHLIRRRGRLNEIGQTTGYFAFSKRTAYFEVRPPVGSHICISRWECTDDLRLLHLGYTADVAQALTSNRTGTEYGWVTETRGMSDLNRRRYDYISRELTKRATTDDDYKVTVAIAKKLLVNGPHDGLMYPTIAMNANADNIALKPAALMKLVPLTLEWDRITKVGELEIGIDIVDSAVTWEDDGTIQWNGRGLQWLIPPGGTAISTRVDGEWRVTDETGRELPFM